MINNINKPLQVDGQQMKFTFERIRQHNIVLTVSSCRKWPKFTSIAETRVHTQNLLQLSLFPSACCYYKTKHCSELLPKHVQNKPHYHRLFVQQ